ncbi:uncharacterized protein [Amphiura filiformis]
MMSFATDHKDALYGLDNDCRILRSPEERKKKRYGISHHMCIHEWEQQVVDISEENNRLVNGDEEKAINDKNDFANDTRDLIDLTSNIEDVITNGHTKLYHTTSEVLMSEASDECDDTVDKSLLPFYDRYSRFVQSMADLDADKFQDLEDSPPDQPDQKQPKPHPKLQKALGAKPPIAPKPLLFRTQSDGKVVKPTAKLPLRPRSGTAESEPALGDENQLHDEDKINKNSITGFSKTKPVVRHVKPPMPAPRTSIATIKTDISELLHTPPPQEVVSPNIENDDNKNIEPEMEINSNETEILQEDGTPGQRRYGVIEPINHDEESKNQNELHVTRPTPMPRISSGSDLGSRYSANLEEIICASPRDSDDLDDTRVSADSCGRFSLDLDNLKLDTSTDDDPQRVSNISVINNELNDTFKEDIPSQPLDNKQGNMEEKPLRSYRESVRNLHVPVRERAAIFERIAADIRASADISSSRNSSVSSTQSHSPPNSPRGSRQMSFGWEREINLRLGVNRSRESSQQSSSTSSTSRSNSSRTHNPVSRSMSSGSVFSDYRQSYSSDDVPFEPVYEVTHVKEQVLEEEAPMLPERCPIERDDLRSARIIYRTRSEPPQPPDELYENINGNEPSQDELYENINEDRRSQKVPSRTHPHEDEQPSHTKVQKQDSTYAVYLDEDSLATEFPAERQKIHEGYYSDGYHGDVDYKENLANDATSKSADELDNGPPPHSPLKATTSISRRRRQAIRKSTTNSRRGIKSQQPQSFDAGDTRSAIRNRFPLRHTDSAPGLRKRQEDDPVSMTTGNKAPAPSKEDEYDEVATLRRELLQESRMLQEVNERLARTDINSPDEEFTEIRVSEDLPWRRTKPRRTRDMKSKSSFEYFEPLCLGSKKVERAEKEVDVATAVDAERTKQHPPDLIQDAINNDAADIVTSNKVKRSSHSYVNVDANGSIDGVDSGNVTGDVSGDVSGDTLYDDVTLAGTSISSINTQENIPVTTPATSEDKKRSRQSLGNSVASESSTASYIDIEEEILSKRSIPGNPCVSRQSTKEEVIIQPKEDDYDLLANTATTQEDDYDLLANTTTTQEDEYDLLANVESQDTSTTNEQFGSDDDAAIEKSSSSSCKDSGEDSDTIYANLTDEPPTPNRDVTLEEDVYFDQGILRESRPSSTYTTYDSALHLKFGVDPDCPEVYGQYDGRPDSTASKNSYLSLLEDFQTMDRDHASYYISDDRVGSTLSGFGDLDGSSSDRDQPSPIPDRHISDRPDVIPGTDVSINASAYQDVQLLQSDIPCVAIDPPVPDEYRHLPVNKASPVLQRKDRNDNGDLRRLMSPDKPVLPPRIEIDKPVKKGLVSSLQASEAIYRQRSKFVNKEPLFQIYQATQRLSDPYARPKSTALGDAPKSPPPRLPRNLPSPCSPPPPPPTSTPPSLRRGQNGNVLPIESVYSEPEIRISVISVEDDVVEDIKIEPVTAVVEEASAVRKVSVTSSVLHRSYWCELREVVKSGVLQEMSDEEKKLQEAMFELITSEASYLRSLNLVISHFMDSPLLKSQMRTTDHHTLFSNIRSVRDASEKLLLELEKRQEESVLIMNVCDILLRHLESDNFNCYAIYCANNQYQLRTLDRVKKKAGFANALHTLESDPECQHLDIQSFLMLPFQRITRLPLLVSAILERIQRLRPQGSEDEYIATSAFAAARLMAKKCDEETTKMERIEEVTLLARQMGYREGVKKMDISQHTTIVKRGHLSMVTMDSGRLGGAKRKIKKTKLVAKSVYILVFKDKVVVAKEKSKGFNVDKDKEHERSYKENKERPRRFEVIDWCQRNLVNVQIIDDKSKNKLPEGIPPSCNYIFVLTFIQNQQKKQMTYILSAASESELTRWVDAISPTLEGQDGERIYESWDCPQVVCIAPYMAKENDELTLQLNDRMDVLTKKPVDGLYKGMRVSDYATGWFPTSCVEEVVNEHVLARNLVKRHQILNQVDSRIKLQKIGK